MVSPWLMDDAAGGEEPSLQVSGPCPTTCATRRCAPTCSKTLGGRDGRPGRLLSVPLNVDLDVVRHRASPAPAAPPSAAGSPATTTSPGTGEGRTPRPTGPPRPRSCR